MSQKKLAASAATLMPLINGFMASRLVQVAAELAIADRLADGAKTSEALARETDTHAPSLHRLLRALASLGVLDEVDIGCFALTALGASLRSGAADSVRNFALMSGSERVWRVWSDLLYSIRTGEPATPHLYGVGVFEYLATHPQEAAIFNAAMAEVTRRVTDAVVAACDFRRFRSIVDVGGGNGALIAAILVATPKLKGVVFDLPSGSAEALRQLAAAGVADRSEVVAGDFFRSVPVGADAYILKNIIHDWDDERAVEILKSCRRAIEASGKLLLIERVMPEKMEASARLQQMALLDVHMLVGPGGRERTEADFRKLFAAAGFRWATAAPLPGDFGPSLVEGMPL